MKILISLFLLVLNTFNIEPAEPKLSVNGVFINQKDDTVRVDCEIINGTKEIIFYKPNSKRDFCLQINYVLFKDLSTKRESYYMPCDALADLSKINITNKNSIKLLPNSHYKFQFILKQNGFNARINSKKLYEILVNINHKYICGGDTCSVFVGFLSAKRNIVTRSVSK